MKNSRKLSKIQLAVLLIHAQVGVGVVTLPYDTFQKAHGDAWISILITGAIIQIILLMFGLLMRRFPNSTIYEIVLHLFGNIFGRMIIVLYCLYLICTASITLAKFSYLLKAWMMPMTPGWILIALMAITSLYLVKEQIHILGRFFVIASVVFIGFIAASIYALKFADFTFIMPVGVNGPRAIFEGIIPSVFAFQGYGFLLIIYPFAETNIRGVIQVASWSNVFVTLFYTFIVFVCLSFFSPDELNIVPEPLLYLVKSFSFRVLERPDLIFTTMWIVLVTTTFMCKLFSTSIGVSILTKTKSHGKAALLIAIISFIGALFFDDEHEISKVSNIFNTFLVPAFTSLPIIFLFVSILFNKKEKVENG